MKCIDTGDNQLKFQEKGHILGAVKNGDVLNADCERKEFEDWVSPASCEICLFPFGKVPRGSRILIYGAGMVGQYFWRELQLQHYCEVVAFVDQHPEFYQDIGISVILPENILNVAFDYVVVAVKKSEYLHEMHKVLLGMGIPGNRIVAEPAFCALDYVKAAQFGDPFCEGSFAYAGGKAAMAFFVGDGLGDAIIAKKLIVTLAARVSNNKRCIDIFGKIAFVEAVFRGEPWLNNIYPSSEYGRKCKRYALAVAISYILRLDNVCLHKLQELGESLEQIVLRWIDRQKNYGLANLGGVANSVHFSRCQKIGLNAYSSLGYQSGLTLDDAKVNIPLLEEFEEQYCSLKLGRYVTVHYGWGLLPNGSSQHVKVWPMEHFARLNELLHEVFPNWSIVQVGGENDAQLSGADEYVLGESIELTKYILQGSKLHIDCEGGLVHVATQLGTKCAVFFGPTPVHYFGYPQNINLVSEKCSNCYYLLNDYSVCARGLEKPECMWSITPELVMERISGFLQDCTSDML